MAISINPVVIGQFIKPTAFDREKTGNVLVLAGVGEINISMGSVDIATKDDFFALFSEAIDIGEEIVVKVEFVLETTGVAFAIGKIDIE